MPSPASPPPPRLPLRDAGAAYRSGSRHRLVLNEQPPRSRIAAMISLMDLGEDEDLKTLGHADEFERDATES